MWRYVYPFTGSPYIGVFYESFNLIESRADLTDLKDVMNEKLFNKYSPETMIGFKIGFQGVVWKW